MVSERENVAGVHTEHSSGFVMSLALRKKATFAGRDIMAPKEQADTAGGLVSGWGRRSGVHPT